LIIKAEELGFQCAGNELKRDPRIAALNAASGMGISKSVHLHGLAIDLLLYKNGKYLENTEDYRELGEWWEKIHPLARWGGRFKDGNHFSFEWEGRK
jgi:hypothetical protein